LEVKIAPISRVANTRRGSSTRRVLAGLLVACLAVVGLALILVVLGVPLVSASPDQADAERRVVVKMTRSAGVPDLRLLGLEAARPLGHDGTYVLKVSEDPDTDVKETLDTVRRLPGVVWAQETAPRSACLIPDDPFYPPSSGVGQWSLPRIRMPEAWELETGSAEVIVAILDTGIDQYRADFAGRIVSPYNAIERVTAWPSWRDNMGHGTAVAGVAVAQGNDDQGMAGVAWNVKIMPVKIADDQGRSDDSILAEGLYWAVDHGADVINISFAGDQVTATEADAIRYAVQRGVTLVAAAGNSYSSFVYYPAALPGVIAVGATTRIPADSRASFSAVGSEMDLTAPGTEIFSHNLGTSSWGSWQGTSFSSPLVAGVAALVRSSEPALTGAQVADVLTGSAEDLGAAGWDREFGWGLVDAYAALEKAGEVAQSTTTTTSSTTTTTAPPTTTTTSTTSTTVSDSTTTTTVPPVTAHFDDVSPESSAYFEQIERLAVLGVISGPGDGLFHPKDSLLRQQFAKMIVRTLDFPVDVTDVCPFTDVLRPPGELYPYHYVAVAWEKGITQGTLPGHFSPYRPLTRAQLITMVARAAGLPEPPLDYETPFQEFPGVHYAYARQAAYAGILEGLEGMGEGYDFFVQATREEVCALLYELLHE
jgi:subtilisin family serine protease